MAPAGPIEDMLGKSRERLLHIDDPLRLDGYRAWLSGDGVDSRLITALIFTLWSNNAPGTIEEARQALEKSERDYSPSTLYKDYAISPTLFHWESQSLTTQRSPTGQRYIKHRELGGQILLFVRARKKQDGLTMPYTFLGPLDYVSHKGERPIAFTWKLQRPMPADFFRAAKVASA